LIVSGTKAIW